MNTDLRGGASYSGDTVDDHRNPPTGGRRIEAESLDMKDVFRSVSDIHHLPIPDSSNVDMVTAASHRSALVPESLTLRHSNYSLGYLG